MANEGRLTPEAQMVLDAVRRRISSGSGGGTSGLAGGTMVVMGGGGGTKDELIELALRAIAALDERLTKLEQR